jgi:hypothetical protein
MSDRRSESSHEGTIEEAKVGIKGDAQTLNQLSSSGRSAQQRRIKKALASLDAAASELQSREYDQSGGDCAHRQEGEK